MSDPWAWWRAALKGEFGPIHESEPQTGYYRMRRAKGGPWQRVAIWTDEIGPAALVEDIEITDPGKLSDLWTRCCRHPITSDLYEAIERGDPWPDDIAEPAPSQNADALTQIDETIRALVTEADKDLASADLVNDGAARDRAANYATRLTELAKEADDLRAKEKEPHLTAGREIDAKWNPVRDLAKTEARKIKDAVGKALVAIKTVAAESGVEVKAKSGTRGKTVALRTVTRIRVVEPAACAAYFATMSTVPADLLDVLQTLARRSHAAGVAVPGVEVSTEEVAA